MRLLSSIGIVLILASSSLAQTRTARQIDGLIGPVHTVTTVHVDLVHVDGIWSESKRYPPNVRIYDQEGNDGRFGNGGPQSVGEAIRIYNEKGQEIEQRLLGPNNVVVMKVLFAYDEAGNVIENSQFDADGKLRRKIACTFDSKRNMTSLGEYDAEAKLYRKLTWTFDEKGNRTEWTESHRKGDEMALFEKLADTYDDNGNMLTETQYGNPEGTVSRRTFAYEFDNRGNWIRRERSFFNGDSTEVVHKDLELRSITYYEK